MQQGRIFFAGDKWIGQGAQGQQVVRSQDRERVRRVMKLNGYANPVFVDVELGGGPSQSQDSSPSADPSQDWDINQRFEFLERLVTMVAQRQAVSLVVTGPGGLGKTHTVRETLEQAGLRDASGFDAEPGPRTYRMVKGYSSAKGLYRELYENQDGLLVFDDCDSVLDNDTSRLLLLGALDSYDRRIISWNADIRDADLERSFQFTGRVIFISNRDRSDIDGALRTRAYTVSLHMTQEQKLQRMERLVYLPTFMPQFEPEHKEAAMALIRRVAPRVGDLSLRSLQAVTRLAAVGGDWETLAEYTITNT
jgi:hypothetical protein